MNKFGKHEEKDCWRRGLIPEPLSQETDALATRPRRGGCVSKVFVSNINAR